MPSAFLPEDDFEPIELPRDGTPGSHEAIILEELRACEDAAEKMERELHRLHKVESAALRVLASMPRRNGEPSSFTMQTFGLIKELDRTLQQEGDDDE